MKNNNIGLTFEDFTNGGALLNFDGFLDFEKAESAEVFVVEMKEGKFSKVFDKEGIERLCTDITAKAIDLVKAGNIDEGVDIIEKGRKDLSKLVKKTLINKNGKKSVVWVDPNKDVKKEKESGKEDIDYENIDYENIDYENLSKDDAYKLFDYHEKTGEFPKKIVKYYLTFCEKTGKFPKRIGKELFYKILKKRDISLEDQGSGSRDINKAEDTDIEKALDSFDYGSDKMLFKKTGKEMKEKLTGIKTKIETSKTENETRAGEILDELKQQPTRKIDEWDGRGVEEETKALRFFDWSKTYFSENSKGTCVGETCESPTINAATTKEEAKLCDEYNQKIRKIITCLKDLKKVSFFERNLEDDKTYDLTTSQATELGF